MAIYVLRHKFCSLYVALHTKATVDLTGVTIRRNPPDEDVCGKQLMGTEIQFSSQNSETLVRWCPWPSEKVYDFPKAHLVRPKEQIVLCKTLNLIIYLIGENKWNQNKCPWLSAGFSRIPPHVLQMGHRISCHATGVSWYQSHMLTSQLTWVDIFYLTVEQLAPATITRWHKGNVCCIGEIQSVTCLSIYFGRRAI